MSNTSIGAICCGCGATAPLGAGLSYLSGWAYCPRCFPKSTDPAPRPFDPEIARLRAEVEAQRRDLKHRCEELESASKLVERLTRERDRATIVLSAVVEHRDIYAKRVAELAGALSRLADCFLFCRDDDSCFGAICECCGNGWNGACEAEPGECAAKDARALLETAQERLNRSAPADHLTSVGKTPAEPAKCGTCPGSGRIYSRGPDGLPFEKPCPDCKGGAK